MRMNQEDKNRLLAYRQRIDGGEELNPTQLARYNELAAQALAQGKSYCIFARFLRYSCRCGSDFCF